MKLSDFQFELPPEQIARYPLARRSDSRLLCLTREHKGLAHRTFKAVLDLVQPGDLLVFNNTKVRRLHHLILVTLSG